MNKFCWFLIFGMLEAGTSSCQSKVTETYVLSKELVKKKSQYAVTDKKRGIDGLVNDKVVIFGGSVGLSDKFLLFDERTQEVSSYLTLPNVSDKVLGILVRDEKILKAGFMSVPLKYKDYHIDDIPVDSLPYQDVWIQNAETATKIDTYPFHYIDKAYDSNFSADGRYVIVNPYTDFTAGYSPKDDDRFYIYDLVDLKRSQIKKQIIKCGQCMNTNLIDDNFIFVKEIEIGGGRDGYYKNIYIAPKSNINDTLKVAHNINIKKVTPDGKFILGQKYLHGKYIPVIIDVALKRFQYLLGREYPMSYSFYSPYEKKFAFDFGTHFVYINFPDTYPFDALSKEVNYTTETEDAAFWKQYQHEALK